MRIEDLDYDLPPECIAQEPPARREDARLLVLDRERNTLEHRGIRDLPSLLAPGDLLVLNDTRVLPARVYAHRDTGGRVEVLLLEPVPSEGEGAWRGLLRAGGTLQPGERLSLADGSAVRIVRPEGGGSWVVVGEEIDLPTLMRRHGRMPLPPYIRREDDDPRDALDRERYQTTFARADGAVAAPTAGLHFTSALLADLDARDVRTAQLSLHVGLGTFEPVRAERLEDHRMHDEAYVLPAEAAAAVRETHAAGGRVVAVGTTSVRALEASAAASPDGLPQAETARTDLMILPGHAFRAVGGLVTNFHLPRSTLIALVSALAGRERVLAAYRTAVAEGYRFYSYGDAMLIL